MERRYSGIFEVIFESAPTGKEELSASVGMNGLQPVTVIASGRGWVFQVDRCKGEPCQKTVLRKTGKAVAGSAVPRGPRVPLPKLLPIWYRTFPKHAHFPGTRGPKWRQRAAVRYPDPT